MRNAAKLNDLVYGGEVRCPQSQVGETKLMQDRDQSDCVLKCGPDEDIEVARETGPRVKSQTVRPYD